MLNILQTHPTKETLDNHYVTAGTPQEVMSLHVVLLSTGEGFFFHWTGEQGMKQYVLQYI